MVSGVAVMAIIKDFMPFTMDPWAALILCAILPAPGLFIWSGQKLGFWSDSTPSRLVNGALLGASIFLISLTTPVFNALLILIIIYFSLFFAVFLLGPFYLNKKGRIFKVEENNENEEKIATSREIK